jgi:O-antigen/teichoic acid export membrane protein
MLRDSLWYLLGAFIPMLVLFIRSPIYTRLFSPSEYGYYSLVNITFTYLSALSYAWIVNCTWRYYLKYKKRNNLQSFYRVLTCLFLASLSVLLIITLVWVYIADDIMLKKLIVYGFIYFTTHELINLSLVTMRIMGQSKHYNIIQIIKAVLTFGLLLFLTFVSHFRIDSFFLSGVIINLFFIVYLLFVKIIVFDFKFSEIRKNELLRFLSYGFAGLGINICFYFLISFDRYVLALYGKIDDVGVYNQVYNLAQISLQALFSVIQAAINPVIINSLESNTSDNNAILSGFAYKTVFLLLPVAIFLSLFARQVSYLLLGPEFREAWQILPYIIAGAFFSGMTHYLTVKHKFRNKIGLVLKGAIVATIINILLNFIFIPKFGMIAAAIITMVSYLVLFIYYYFYSDLRFLSDNKFKLKYIFIFIVLLLIGVLYYVILYFTRYDSISILQSLLVVMFFSAIYFILTLKINPFLKNIA